MLADVKELQIRYVPSEIKVMSNKEALAKIIRNGLDNAIKYTNKGGVVVGLRRRARGGYAFKLQTPDLALRTTKSLHTTKAGGTVPA